MHIMFVCTGNICRSPMGELLLTRYLSGTTVQVSSAGTHGLPMHQIDPNSALLMESVGIEPSGFRSRRLTQPMAKSADLILCFEKDQRKDIVTLAPTAVKYTFLLGDFANMCEYCARNGLVKGLTIQERLQSVMTLLPLFGPCFPNPRILRIRTVRNMQNSALPPSRTNKALRTILTSMRKHYRVEEAPVRPQITRRMLTRSDIKLT